MAKVQFTHTSGRIETMEERFASILRKLGRGQYQTRDMRAYQGHIPPHPIPVPVPAPALQTDAENDAEQIKKKPGRPPKSKAE